MIQKTKVLFKDFFRNPFYDTLLCCGLVYLVLSRPAFSVIQFNRDNLFSSALDGISIVSQFLATATFLFFILFLLISYEFLRSPRTNQLEEALQCIPSGGQKTAGLQLAVPCSLLFAFSLLVFALVYFPFREWVETGFPKGFGRNLVTACALYAFLPGLAGILLGAAWHRARSRVAFYAFFVLSAFMISPMAGDFFLAAGNVANSAGGMSFGAGCQKVLDFWYRLSPVCNSFFNPTYAIATEPYRFALVGFWCLLGLGFFVLTAKKGWKSRLAAAVCLTLCLCCATLGWYRGSDPQEHMATPIERHAIADYTYYETHSQEPTVAPTFHVIQCDLDLRAFIQLDATADLTLDGSFCKTYTFTLYHGYRVSEVTDGNGRGLSFLQEGDCVNVENPSDVPIESLIFYYRGCHPALYSSAQGSFLPGYLCYYPVEGTRQLYGEYCLNTDFAEMRERKFTLRFTTAAEVFTNLPQQKDGSFAGTAESVTIVAGMFRQEELDGVQYIMPWCMSKTDIIFEMRKKTDELNATLGTDFSAPIYSTVIYSPDLLTPVPDGGTGHCVAIGNTLLIGSASLGPDVSQAVTAHCRSVLRNAPDSAAKEWFFTLVQDVLAGNSTGTTVMEQSFGSDPPEAYLPLDYLTSEENEARAIGFYIYRAILQTSLKETAHALFDYLAQGGEDDMTFVQSLGG